MILTVAATGSCAHLIHIKILKINLDRLCFRLHDGSNDGT